MRCYLIHRLSSRCISWCTGSTIICLWIGFDSLCPPLCSSFSNYPLPSWHMSYSRSLWLMVSSLVHLHSISSMTACTTRSTTPNFPLTCVRWRNITWHTITRTSSSGSALPVKSGTTFLTPPSWCRYTHHHAVKRFGFKFETLLSDNEIDILDWWGLTVEPISSLSSPRITPFPFFVLSC